MVYESQDYFENRYIILDNDIVLNDDVIANPSAAKPWMPIGKWGLFKDGKFLGSFDGRGHTIYGLYISCLAVWQDRATRWNILPTLGACIA